MRRSNCGRTCSPSGRGKEGLAQGGGGGGTGRFVAGKGNQRENRRQVGQHGQILGGNAQPESLGVQFQNAQATKETLSQLNVPDDQKALAEGCKALADGNEDAAFSHLLNATHLADGAFLAGVLALKKAQFVDATKYLSAAADQEKELGRYLANYGIAATLSLPITEEVTAHIEPSHRGVLLALAEAYQAQDKLPDALDCLERLQEQETGDVVVKLSLAELLLESGGENKETLQKVVKLTEGVENESTAHAALLLYKAQALRGLGLLDGAADVLTATLRRQKERPDELLRALRYERALVYEGQGQTKKARTEFEKLYAEDPNYEDVATRLKV